MGVTRVLGRIVVRGLRVLAPRGQRLARGLGTSSSIFNRAASLAASGFGASPCALPSALSLLRVAGTFPGRGLDLWFSNWVLKEQEVFKVLHEVPLILFFCTISMFCRGPPPHF